MHIFLCLYEDALDPYNTMQDLFDHLKLVYKDPNWLFTAKNKFKKLYMKPMQSFHEFHTKFLQLANKAKIVPMELKYELNNKLLFSLQKAVISHFNTDSSFQEFAKCEIWGHVTGGQMIEGAKIELI
jgi:hypothetical protein